MTYYNKNDEHKYKFVIWVAVCCAVFLLITIAVVVCSIYVFNKKHDDDSANKISNSKAVESMFSSMPQSSSTAESRAENQSPANEASTNETPASQTPASPASQQETQSQVPGSQATDNSSVFADFIVNLPVTCIRQNPELPQGCEVTSLAIAMNYKGYAVDKMTLTTRYLPTIAADSEKSYAILYYLGDPRLNYPGGLYCLEGAIKATIDNYNKENSPVTYRDLSWLDPADLYAELDKGNPVIVWVTVDFQNPNKKDVDYYTEYYNLHCMVLTGYSDDKVALADPLANESDPLNGIRIISKDRFESVWMDMDQRAISIQ